MEKRKLIRIVVNSVLLVAVIALGVTVYQAGNETKKQQIQEELAKNSQEDLQEEPEQEDEQEPMVDAGANDVEADLVEDGGQTAQTEPEVTQAPEETADTSAAAETAPTVDVNFTEDSLMSWPVEGQLLMDYSMDETKYFATLDQYRYNPAIVIQSAVGAPVMAAANGTVVSIENKAETGTTVTMDLGNGYQAIYGQLGDVQVGEGQTVSSGTVVGYVTDPTKYYSVEGSNLFFKMTKDGSPIDPIQYLP